MAKEIERKFLVNEVPLDLTALTLHSIHQGYLPKSYDAPDVLVHVLAAEAVVVVRKDSHSFKYVIPREDASQMVELFCTGAGLDESGIFGHFRKGPDAPATRFRVQDGVGYLTIKGKPLSGGMTRDEFEYEIPLADARLIIGLFCQDLQVAKSRYCVPHGPYVIELDVFHGALEGFVMAEVELPSEDAPFEPPAWFGVEVSNDPQYSNINLAKRQSGK
ncbi:aconitate hydratase B [Novimethylophilus kurashikiensis]|uniref:Aconitate hydratase B n=1 Tax=Novimethylophilus kurashikiensis TaxID=1825523 RepID=A0A2R5F7M3_9PROT|nr:CYTH domain-containing protein [Novimethylophilus kurashikiensis]GBG14240.1 aconitate hydratase B [Novimethylophilus kurashikiensis]